ncbi:MAG: MurT ligase domain-containing protein [Dehalococcoidia bacterium]
MAVVCARAVGAASRRLKRGGGTALPGLVAERVDPALVAHLARQLGGGRVIVTGTNGKTTTSRMLAEMVRIAGRAPVHNRSGSNLMRGLAATLAGHAGGDGRIPDARQRAGIFEVDEATIPQAVAAIRPQALVIGNLFRDQLDRYGEVDSITALWRQAIARLPTETALVLNADDPTVATLAHDFAGRSVFFGVDDADQATMSEHAADSRWCGRCGAEYRYDHAFFWHIGHWRCPGCGEQRPSADVAATRVRDNGEGVALALRTPAGSLSPSLPLNGLYNVYNALAATTAALALRVPTGDVGRGISGFSAAFGRQESLTIDGRSVRILLCKNPAGVNQVLRTILTDPEPLRLLFLLNDGIADGRDISWIWDVDFELLRHRTEIAIAGGQRAADMALRLKYADLTPPAPLPSQGRGEFSSTVGGSISVGSGGAIPIEPTPDQTPPASSKETIVQSSRVRTPPSLRGKGAGGLGIHLEPTIPDAVARLLAATPIGGRAYVLPTYTAMLDVRDLLAARAGERRFWEH